MGTVSGGVLYTKLDRVYDRGGLKDAWELARNCEIDHAILVLAECLSFFQRLDAFKSVAFWN